MVVLRVAIVANVVGASLTMEEVGITAEVFLVADIALGLFGIAFGASRVPYELVMIRAALTIPLLRPDT